MATKTISKHTAAESCRLVLTLRQKAHQNSITACYARLSEEKNTEILVKEFPDGADIPDSAHARHDGPSFCTGETVTDGAQFRHVVQENITDLVRLRDSLDPVCGLETHGILAGRQNWLVHDAGLSADLWDDSEKLLDITLAEGTDVRLKFCAERPYFFRAEFVSGFPGAKFDFFTEDDDLHKGPQSKTLKAVTGANHDLFSILSSPGAERLFRERIYIVKNRPLNGSLPCVDCVRSLFLERRSKPKPGEDIYGGGSTASRSFTELYSGCLQEGKSWR